MFKVNGTVIENVKFYGVDLDKIIVNGVIVFEKMSPQENIVTMKTLQNNISLLVKTKDGSPCEVWNAENKIGVLNNNSSTAIPIPNKNEAVIIKGKDITTLLCPGNQLTSLNVQGLNSLQNLCCYENQLTSLNVQGLNSLRYLYCFKNQLTSLNAQGLNSLQYLYCFENQLTSLNAQGLNSLQYLYCYENQLTSLNVQGLNSLQHLHCFKNQLTAQAFKEIFNNLLQTEKGKAFVYNDNDNNYKDFTRPSEMVEAFNGAKARGWKFYKNYVSDSNLL